MAVITRSNYESIEVTVVGRVSGTVTRNLAVHPIALAFPIMTGPELRRLYDDILAHGIAEPVTLFEGKVIDGRHRLAIAHLLNKPVTIREFGGNAQAARSFTFSINLMRRHLSPAQTGQLILEWYSTEARLEAERNGRTVRPARSGGWAQIASAKAGGMVSPASLVKLDQARLRDAPVTQRKVEAGEIKSISEAAKLAAAERGVPAPAPITTSVGDHVSKARYSIQRAVIESVPDELNSDPSLLAASLFEIEEACEKLRKLHNLGPRPEHGFAGTGGRA